MSAVEILIITYNSADHIGDCLDAARSTGAPIVVIDNASTDETASQVRQRGVHLIANPVNAGFAAAVNQGFRCTTAPFILLLNPDAQILCGLDALREACSLPG